MDIDLFLLNKLQQLKNGNTSSGGSGSGAAFIPNTDAAVPTSSQKPIATVFGHNERGSGPFFNWSTGIPEGTVNIYSMNNDTKRWAFFGARNKLDMDPDNMGLYYNIVSQTNDNMMNSGVHWAADQFVGLPIMSGAHSWSSSYAPIGFRMMFIRNKTASNQTFEYYGYHSNTYNSGYDGTSAVVYKPNSPNFTDVTSVIMDHRYNYSGNTWIQSFQDSFTIPAYTTVALGLYSSFGSWTGTGNVQWLYHFNGFYNLDSSFNNSTFECDLRATEAYAKMHDSQFQDNTSSNNNIIRFFNNVGHMYGNWEQT